MQGSSREAYYLLVGKIVKNYAALEVLVCSAIWQIAEIPDNVGACLTSNIYSLEAKIKALQAILRVKGDFESTARELATFYDGIRGLSEFRNRIVHDATSEKDGVMGRLEITANKKLKMEFVPEDLISMNTKGNEIDDAFDKLKVILKPAIEAFPPLPLA